MVPKREIVDYEHSQEYMLQENGIVRTNPSAEQSLEGTEKDTADQCSSSIKSNAL